MTSDNRSVVEVLAKEIGETDKPASEDDRISFEAWMRGHCWKIEGQWNGAQYVHETEGAPAYRLHQGAMTTRGLFAAWRDRGELARRLSPQLRADVVGSLERIRLAADNGGMNEAQCYSIWRTLTAALKEDDRG